MCKKLVTTFSAAVLFFVLLVPGFSFAQSDPATIPVYVAAGPITVDGILDEPDWSIDVPHLMFKVGGVASGNSYTPTDHVVVKPPYSDSSTTYVKFLRSGMDLYISLESDDQQIGRFDWEGDGLFMKIQNAAAADIEYKIYVGLDGTTPAFVYETNGPPNSGAGVGVADGTIYDSTDTDNGYTAELVIHLDELGFAAVPPTVTLMMVIFDPNGYSQGDPPWGPTGNFAKQWWGSEWGGVYRTLTLTDVPIPVELTSFSAARVSEGVLLSWSTATEVNNAGFEVEKSTDKVSFQSISFVEGNGTTTSPASYSYIDREVTGTVYYRLKQVDFDGTFEYSKVVEVSALPVEYSISQNYPNPFNPSTTVSFSIPMDGTVSIKVYDILGNEAATIANDIYSAGKHDVNFNASNLSSGVYYYTIKSGNFVETKKLVLLK